MNKIILLGILFLMTNLTLSQNKISGKITDISTNKSLTGVSIYINDLKRGVITDINGNYVMPKIKSGNYLIEVSYLGYNSIVNHYNITSDTVIDISLSTSHKELSQVVITGVSRSTKIKQNPIIIKSIDKNYLNTNTSNNIIDAMKNIPGVNQISTGVSISKPVIRGLGYNRVISLLNGIKQEGQQWGDEHGMEIDEYAIDKIEVIKGPGSLMYGSDGIAGVINFLTPKSPLDGKINTQFISNYQTNNNLIGYSFSNAGNINGVEWLGRISNKFGSNYQNSYDGKVLNSGFKELNGSLFLGLNRSWGFTHLHINSYNTTINLPEGERDSLGQFVYENVDGDIVSATEDYLKGYKTGFPHQVVNNLNISSNNYFILDKGTINIDFGFQNNKRKEYADIANPHDIELFFDLNTFNYNGRYNLNKIEGWDISVGVGGMLQDHTNKGEEYLIPDYTLFDFGIFAFTQKTLYNKLTLAGGLRYDNRIVTSNFLLLDSQVKFNSFDKNFGGLSGSIGISYQSTEYSTIKLNFARGYRAPNISELSSNGRHEGTFRYELGNKNLIPEISHQFDIAYFVNSEHITFEFTPFINFISNYIYSNKLKDINGNDVIIDSSDPAPAFQYTQGNATILGGEIYLDIHPHPFDWLHIANSISYVQATQSRATDSTKYLPFIPAPKYRLELKSDFKSVGKYISNAYIKFGLDYFFSQNNIFRAYDTETPTPAYTLLGIGVGGKIKAYGKPDMINIFINVENLADVRYQNHLSRLKYAPENTLTRRTGIFNQGRNFSIKLLLNI